MGSGLIVDSDSPSFAWDQNYRAHLRTDHDAFYARAYVLTHDDYPSATFRVWKKREIRQYGEYRTRRLVLAAWDRMEANGEFTAMGM